VGVLPNIEAMPNLVTRMEKVADSMSKSAEKSEISARVMLKAAKINQKSKE
jgi:hypothetical protein